MLAHVNNEFYECPVCMKRLRTGALLTKHMSLHSRQRSYKRRTGYSHRARGSARSGEKQYACRKCKMKYTVLKSLKRHMLISHSQDSLSEVLNSNSHLEESPRNFPVTNSDGYTCRTCGQLFNFQHDLQEHLSLNHTGIYPNSPSDLSFSDQVDRKFSCPDCGKCFKRRSHMTEHQLIHKLHETGVAAYRCQECQKQFFHKGHFNVHIRTHSGERPYGCLMCSRNFNTNAQLNRHLTSHHKDLNGESYCDSFMFTPASNALNEDFRKSDDGDSKLTKDEQSCTFFETISQETQNLSTSLHSNESQIEHSASPLKQHSKKNRTERVSYLCDVCNKQFFHKGSYTVHIRTHTGEKPFACIICNRKFNTKSQLNRHMSVHTDKKSDQESDHSKQNCEKEEDDGATERNYQCNFCGKRFKRRSHLNEHQLLHKLQKSGERPELCTICGKRFLTPSHLRVHMRSHVEEKPFACQQCSKQFRSMILLRQHLKSHTNERPFKCSSCEKSFRLNYNLKIHMTLHTGERPYVCQVCGKKWGSQACLNKCMRKHNKRSGLIANQTMSLEDSLSKKPYACSICNKHFACSGNLRPHMRIHTGEKPFVCDLCGKAFSQKQAMKKHFHMHERKHSNQTNADQILENGGYF